MLGGRSPPHCRGQERLGLRLIFNSRWQRFEGHLAGLWTQPFRVRLHPLLTSPAASILSLVPVPGPGGSSPKKPPEGAGEHPTPLCPQPFRAPTSLKSSRGPQGHARPTASPPCPPLLPLSPLLTVLLTHRSPGCFTSIWSLVLPQGLCMGCALSLDCPSSLHGYFFLAIELQFKCHFLRSPSQVPHLNKLPHPSVSPVLHAVTAKPNDFLWMNVCELNPGGREGHTTWTWVIAGP